MLTSGGEPLQLTNDEGEKLRGYIFGRRQRNLLRELWAAVKCGRCQRGVASRCGGICTLCGRFAGRPLHFYVKPGAFGIFRAEKPG